MSTAPLQVHRIIQKIKKDVENERSEMRPLDKWQEPEDNGIKLNCDAS